MNPPVDPSEWPRDDEDPAAHEPLFDDVRETGIPEVEESALVECWRCGKRVEDDRARCPFCQAPFRSSRAEAVRADVSASIDQDVRAIKVLLWSFSLLLVISIFQAWYIHFGPGIPAGPKDEQEKALLEHILIFEAIDTLFVLLAIAWSTAPRPVRRKMPTRVTAWAIAAPVLGLLLGLNILYAKTLEHFLGWQPHLEVIELNFKTHFWLVFLAVCIQPAVVEELFFRYLALGLLRRVMAKNGAVWVSAVMFGMAHLHNPLGVPILIVIGAGLGYMRLMSGGLLLPMLLHCFHNVFVLMLEGNV